MLKAGHAVNCAWLPDRDRPSRDAGRNEGFVTDEFRRGGARQIPVDIAGLVSARRQSPADDSDTFAMS